MDENNAYDLIEKIESCFTAEQAEIIELLLIQAAKPPPKKRRNTNKKTIINKTIDYMKSLGTYRKEFEQIIEIYADMVCQYNYLSAQFQDSGFQVLTDTERHGVKKSPVLVCLENLRKDIGTYSDRLMLNAKTYAAEIEKPQEQASAFAALMAKHQRK